MHCSTLDSFLNFKNLLCIGLVTFFASLSWAGYSSLPKTERACPKCSLDPAVKNLTMSYVIPLKKYDGFTPEEIKEISSGYQAYLDAVLKPNKNDKSQLSFIFPPETVLEGAAQEDDFQFELELSSQNPNIFQDSTGSFINCNSEILTRGVVCEATYGKDFKETLKKYKYRFADNQANKPGLFSSSPWGFLNSLISSLILPKAHAFSPLTPLQNKMWRSFIDDPLGNFIIEKSSY